MSHIQTKDGGMVLSLLTLSQDPHNIVYKMVSWLVDNFSSQLKVSTKTLAKHLNIHSSSAYKALKKLESRGILVLENKHPYWIIHKFNKVVALTKPYNTTTKNNNIKKPVDKCYSKKWIQMKWVRIKNAMLFKSFYFSKPPNLREPEELAEHWLRRIIEGRAKFYPKLGKLLMGREFYKHATAQTQSPLQKMAEACRKYYQGPLMSYQQLRSYDA